MESLLSPGASLASLLAATFLAATLIPLSSEAVLFAVLRMHGELLWSALAVATLGNTLGGMTSYLIGRYIGSRKPFMQLDRLRRDWRDRFGSFPMAVDNLFLLTEIKLAAARSGVSRVEVRERKLMLTQRGDFILVAGKFPRLVAPEIEQQLGEVLELIKKL